MTNLVKRVKKTNAKNSFSDLEEAFANREYFSRANFAYALNA
ncbi:MAG: hypothetical protein UR52_C0017G0006 [Candidatus Gottesmanbacteria bacterium GW2011_GWA1_34_13]|uniref:Uncharacterized protein n=1 Tax=Candidatus Gottesmanbacteria bacterium GW2011_GWA1_34_13 TaxID=1618434 RepID=A0A0G0D604_9BACT|nr:MAG: hypothetical protein UR52_C0017G0006 [Candidatus Gottesmanbacteria bacterium GW2011_GWA1_34_13]